MESGRHRNAVQALELKLPPVAVFLIAGIGMWLASHYLGAAAFSIPGARLLATACAAAGIIVGIAGIVAFRGHGTTVHPMHPHKASMLVESGIYRFKRNPMYLGLALVLTGWLFVLGNAASALFLPAFIGYMLSLIHI